MNKLVAHGLSVFFPKSVAYEPDCEPYDSCTADMYSFKGYLHRWYSMMTLIAPFTAPIVLPVLKTSAQAAITQCTGGAYGRQCGFKWNTGKYDGVTGAGQQMNVVGAVSSLLIGGAKPPYTAATGGTSKGNVNAGSGSDSSFQNNFTPITTADRAGAGILTFLVLASACGMFGWMSVGH